MKVLIDALNIREGGGVTYVRSLLGALAQTDHANKYHMLVSKHYQQNLLVSVPSVINKVEVDLTTGLVGRWLYQQLNLIRLIRNHSHDLLLTLSDIGLLKAPCPHVVVAHNYNIYAPINIYVKWRERLRLLYYRVTREPWAYLTLRNADRIVFVTRTFCEQVISQLRLDPFKAHVVHHGVSPIFTSRDRSSISERRPLRSELIGQPYLLAVSTLAPHKSYDVLIAAFAKIARHIQDLHLNIAGGGVGTEILREELKCRARVSGVGERVHFLGLVKHEHLPDLYRHATAFILSSQLETFGLPLVEAMASGTPVIASDLPVCQEICRNAALYFATGDVSDLADRIRLMLEDAILRQRLREIGLKRAREFLWERTAFQLAEILKEVAHGENSSSSKE